MHSFIMDYIRMQFYLSLSVCRATCRGHLQISTNTRHAEAYNWQETRGGGGRQRNVLRASVKKNTFVAATAAFAFEMSSTDPGGLLICWHAKNNCTE